MEQVYNDFNIEIVNFPFLHRDVLRSPPFGVKIFGLQDYV